MKVRILGVICLCLGACSAADGQSDDRSQAIHELEVQEPDETGNPTLVRQGAVERTAPASAQKPTPDPWRIAPAVDKPTPDPWSGEACGAPAEATAGECATSHETGHPTERPQSVDP